MNMPEKGRMVKYYEDLYDKYGYDHRSLDWKDPVGQKVRYSVLMDCVKMAGAKPGFSVADIGSGLGHLYGYLKANKFFEALDISYKGYDISPKLVEAAKKKFPEADFDVKDILEGYFTERFDFVFSCGIFNIRFASVFEHEAFVKEMLLRMYESCRTAVAVNFLSINGVYYLPDKTREADSIYHYFKPEDIVELVRSFTGRYDLRHDYHLADFTVYMFKERR